MTNLKEYNSKKVSRLKYLVTSAFPVLFLFWASAIIAQTGSVNFSGTWAFNESKSTQAQGGFRMAASTMVITHNSVSLEVGKTQSGPDGNEFKTNDKFTTDGKECVNTFFNDNQRKSVVKWSPDGKSLIFNHSMTFERDGQTNEFKSSETWKINDSDKTLVIETVFNGPNGERKATNVYDKK